MPVYDPPSGSYTSTIPPGTKALRSYVASKFGYTRTEVVRDASRCRAKGSEHCDCRGIDCFTVEVVKGRRLFDWCVANAERFGIQSVIFRDREWGFGRWVERHRSKKDHFDHVHIGLNRWAAKNLTQAILEATEEDGFMADLTEAEQKELLQAARDLRDVKQGSRLDTRLDAVDARQRRMEEALARIEAKLP